MAYIGNSSTTQSFTPAIDYFSGNGSTTAFTLSRPVASAAQVMVVVNNVPQHPTTAFSVSGNTITFTGAPSTGTNNIYVYYTTLNQQVVQPGQGTVGTSQLVDSAVTAAKIANSTITPSKLTVGAISWDASGRVTLPYQPSFKVASSSSSSALTSNTWTKVALNTAYRDIGSNFNTSTYRFTAPITGVYIFIGHVNYNQNVDNISVHATFAYNGVVNETASSQFYTPGITDARGIYQMVTTAMYSMDAGDYVELFGKVNGTPSGSFNGGSNMAGYLVG